MLDFSYKRLTKGILGSNTYIVWSPSKIAVIIDPGNTVESIMDIVNGNNLSVKYIIMTHVHLDHIFYLEQLCAELPQAITVCHNDDLPGFENPSFNASILFGSKKIFQKAQMTVTNGDTLTLENEYILKIIHTPGHTPGGMCILAGDMLFSGDTLFYDGFGRTDLGYGDIKDLAESIKLLYSFEDDMKVFPGHGTASTIGRERTHNPFMEW